MAAKKSIMYRVGVTDRFTKPLRRMQSQLESFKRTAESVDRKMINPKVDVQTAKASKQLDAINRKAEDIPNLVPIAIVVKEFGRVKGELDLFNKRVDTIADRIRNFSVVFQSAISGSIYAMLPAATTMVSVFGAGVANLGPVIGTAAGGLMAMASSVGAAAGGVGMLIPFVASLGSDLAGLDKDVERNSDRFNGLSKATQNALTSLDGMRSAFERVKTSIRDPIYAGMALWFQAAEKAIGLATPAIEGMADAFGRLGGALNSSLGSSDVKANFDWLGTAAPRSFENIGKAVGNFTVGLLNMLRAFDPLAASFEDGFLRMSESFRKWTDSLSGSEKFQNFIAYVQENGPKLLGIIGNIVGGLVGMFSAFAPLSADMLTAFEEMTAKFEEWGQTLAENKSFQDFINFVRENTPATIEFIGRLTEFLITLGQGFATVGSTMLPLINNFLQFATWLMQTFPWVAKLAALIPTLYGAFKLLAFPITLVTSAIRILSPVVTTLFTLFGSLGGAFTRIMPIIVRTGTFLLRFGSPINIIISLVILLATVIISNWDKIKAWTVNTFSAVKSYISSAWSTIRTKTFEAALAMYLAARNKFIEMKTAVTSKMSEIKSQIQEKWDAAKEKVRSILQNTVNAVKSKFVEMKSEVQNKMNEVKDKIIELWNKAQDFLEDIDLMEIGKNIVDGLINGIKAKAGDAVQAAKDLAADVKDAVAGFFKVKSPSRLMMSIGGYIGEGLVIGIDKMKSPAQKAAEKLADAINKPLDRMATSRSFSVTGQGSYDADFGMGSRAMDYGNHLGTSLDNSRSSRQGSGSNENMLREMVTALRKENDRFRREFMEQHHTIVAIDGNEFARATVKDITDYQQLNAQLARGGR